jgi:hypothetical protein
MVKKVMKEETEHPPDLQGTSLRPFPGRALAEKAAADSDFHSNWLITLSDLLSLLLIFFVMLSVTASNPNKAGGVKTETAAGLPVAAAPPHPAVQTDILLMR